MARKSPHSQAPLALKGDLDVFSIHEQWELVQPLLQVKDGTATLDLSGIGDLDLSGIQLLCALDRDLQAKGGLRLTGVEEDWKIRFHLLGLTGIFEKEAS